METWVFVVKLHMQKCLSLWPQIWRIVCCWKLFSVRLQKTRFCVIWFFSSDNYVCSLLIVAGLILKFLITFFVKFVQKFCQSCINSRKEVQTYPKLFLLGNKILKFNYFFALVLLYVLRLKKRVALQDVLLDVRNKVCAIVKGIFERV